MAKKIVLAGACRTAIGVMGGALSTTPAPELGTIVIKEALKRSGVKPEQVDMVYMGCVIQAGTGQNPARQAAVNAGIPVESPAITINVLCGSGLDCVNTAARMIREGEADIIVAGGIENMSMAPYALQNARFGYRMGNNQIYDTMITDALTDAFHHYHMGITAENVAEQWGLTREELDAFAANSQQKACAAIASGRFKDEIVPVEIKKKKETVLFDTDEGPRQGRYGGKPLQAPSRLQERRHGHCRKRFLHQRRRGRHCGHERGKSQGTGRKTHGDMDRRNSGRRGSLHYGCGPHRGHEKTLRQNRPDHSGHGSG